MVLAAEEKRHYGEVAYLLEAISHSQLYRSVVDIFDEKVRCGSIPQDARVSGERWLAFQLCPANEHVRSALQFAGRFPLKLQLQVRTLLKEHARAYFCAKKTKLTHEWAHKHRLYTHKLWPA